MLRWITFCACLAGLSTTGSLALEPASRPSLRPTHSSDCPISWALSPDKHRMHLTLLPNAAPATVECSEGACKPDVGLPQTERDFLAQQRWAKMPAFEIFEEPLPSPMALVHPPVCVTPDPAVPTASTMKAKKSRYVCEYQLPPPPVPATVTVSDESSAVEYPHLNLPAPLADPAAMVVQLFERLKASEERAADAERRLAAAQQKVTSPRTTTSATHHEPASEVVVLEMRCFEIDLDRVAEADVELAGVCKQSLSRSGLFAAVANGAFDQRCACSEIASGPDDDACPFSGCTDCPAEKVAVAPDTGAKASTSCTHGRFVEDVQKLERVLGQLQEAGALHNISRPRLMTRSGETARMMVGRQFALKTAAAERGRAVGRTEFCTAGTNIEATPLVKAGGDVQIELHAEWSAIDEMASQENGQPVLDRRSVSTHVELPAGKTVVVAGLMQHDAPVKPCAQGVAVPGEDRVFRNATDEATASGNRKEFIVLITPKMIAPIARTASQDVQR